MESNSDSKSITFNDGQLAALEAVDTFVRGDGQVFILHGYAGTGKTTLMREVVNRYRQTWHIEAMAPTGRAAHVLEQKINIPATTIHRGAFNFDNLSVHLNGKDMADSDFKFVYPVRQLEMPTLVIVDEASMIPNVYSEGELWTFGTNFLLDDLLSHVFSESHSKVIFVGDDAQLPPVGEASSKALQEDFFIGKGLKVQSATLTEIMRQDDGLILKNATAARNAYAAKNYSNLVFEEGTDVKQISMEEVTEYYTGLFPRPEIGDSAVICYSNRQAADYNRSIRKAYYGMDNPELRCGDILMVVANHYDRTANNGVSNDIMNGELAKVVRVDADAETRSVPVYVKENGSKIKKQIPITYQGVALQLQNGRIMDCKIITNLLDSNEKNLTVPEIKSIYIDFCIRNPHLKSDTPAFMDALCADPYVNAIKVKYGYAATCHKTQGGEWNTVIVDFSGVTLCQNGLRWIYTATTRAKNMLYGVNIPSVRPMDKLRINNVSKMTNLPADWPQAESISIEELLKSGPFRLEGVCELPYRHRYKISDDKGVYTADVLYNGRGSVTSVQCACDELKTLLSGPREERYQPCLYSPSTPTAQQLYEAMLDACERSNTKIISVQEHLNNYHILYCLQGDDKATIDFFFNGRGFITYGAPSSKAASHDEKLMRLIEILEQNS